MLSYAVILLVPCFTDPPVVGQVKFNDNSPRLLSVQQNSQPRKKAEPKRAPQPRDAADADGDGKVSEAERKAFAEKTRARLQRVRAKLDTNGDGKISESEWQAVTEEWRDAGAELDRSLKSLDSPARAALIKAIDANGDGQIDDTERAVLRDRTEVARLEFIARFDADGDGRVVGDERRALAEALSAVRAKVLSERPRQAADDKPARKADEKSRPQGQADARQPAAPTPASQRK